MVRELMPLPKGGSIAGRVSKEKPCQDLGGQGKESRRKF